MNQVSELIEGLLTIIMAVIALAIISVIVSRQANTPSVITAVGQFFNGIIQTAVNPLSNTSSSANPFSAISSLTSIPSSSLPTYLGNIGA